MFHETYTSSAATAASTEMMDCSSTPVCPVCGGLECYCRPRFFAGQLLTEADLNRLEQYVIAKNRLHNRYLHGWGVVCGLEVVCHPCNDRVTVRAGYALSPCGDDIVLCQDVPVDVCTLIQQCRQVERSYAECLSSRPSAEDDTCKEVVDEWVLAVCYDEKPSRGITALKGSSGAACCSRCACGGSSACGCGCHGSGQGQTNGNGKSTQTASRRNPLPQCEPTLICEGYRFIAYKKPKEAVRDNINLTGLIRRLGIASQADLQSLQIGGKLGRRYHACASLFLDQWGTLPKGDDREQLHTWCCETKASLLDFFERNPTGDCHLYDRVRLIECPVPNDEKFLDKIRLAREGFTQIGEEYLYHCLCSALLPPCPDPVAANCVPLATLKIRRNPCEVEQVCNWCERRLVVTFPHLGYWLSPFGLIERLRKAIVKLCCARINQVAPPAPQPDPPIPIVAAPGASVDATPAAGTEAAAAPQPGSALSRLLWETWRRKTPLDGQAWLIAALGGEDDQRQPLASPLELALPAQSLLLNQVIKPGLDDILAAPLSRLLDTAVDDSPVLAAVAEPVSGEGADLRDMVVELRRTVEAQGAEIERLKTRRGR